MAENHDFSRDVVISLDSGMPYRFNERVLGGDNFSQSEMTAASVGFSVYDFVKSNIDRNATRISLISGRPMGESTQYRNEFSIEEIQADGKSRVQLGNGRAEYLGPEAGNVGVYRFHGKNMAGAPRCENLVTDNYELMKEFLKTQGDLVGSYLEKINKVGMIVETAHDKCKYVEINL